MKKLFALGALALSWAGFGQNPVVAIFGSVTDSLGQPVAGQVVLFTSGPAPGTTGPTITYTTVTGASGQYYDSLLLGNAVGYLMASTVDCNGGTLSQSMNYTPNNGPSFSFNANFVLCTVGTSNPLTCSALFYPDSNQATAGMVYLVNASSTNYSGPATTVSTVYGWDFGDGTTATGAYPNHFYSAPGSYEVCVTMASSTSNGATCTSSYCDTLTVDSTGFLVFKTESGFTLQVIDASQLRTSEWIIPSVSVAPNPARAGQPLMLTSSIPLTRSELVDLSGRVLYSGSSERIPTANLAPGTYVLRCQTAHGTTATSVVITAP